VLESLTPIKIETRDQAEGMRYIRNMGRMGYSRDKSYIPSDRQDDWWEKNKDSLVAFLFYDQTPLEKLIGYAALILADDGKYYNSCGVIPDFRGNGYGREMTNFLLDHTDKEVWSIAMKSNPAAVNLRDPAYWEIIYEDEEVIKYRNRRRA